MNCKTEMWLNSFKGLSSVPIPRYCPNYKNELNIENCAQDPFILIPDKCIYIDVQYLKLQEIQKEVPTGEMPRHIKLFLERDQVNKTVPGTRINVVGIYSIYESYRKKQSTMDATICHPYLRVVGIDELNPHEIKGIFEPREEEMLKKLSQDENIYKKIVKSIAPEIFGRKNIKKAIACLLFGGTRKEIPGSIRLRGDINILLLGC